MTHERKGSVKSKNQAKSKHCVKFNLLLVLLCIAGSCLLFSGCSKESVDDQFVSSLEKGLSARWLLVDKEDDKEDAESTKSDYEDYINAELDEVSKFSDKTFEDEDFGKLAKEYIDILNESLAALDNFGNDSKFIADWNNVYQNRVECLAKINEKKPLEFSKDSDKERWDGLLSEGKITQGARRILDSVNFKLTDDDYGWKTYVAWVENSTETRFSYFQIDYKLVDKNGNTLDTGSTLTDNWEPGEKVKFEFSTDENVKKVEATRVAWDY